MDGETIFGFSITKVPKCFREFLELYKCGVGDFDFFVLYQANLMILKQIAKKVRIPEHKMPIAMDRYGNTSSASVPMTIVDLCETPGQESGHQTGHLRLRNRALLGHSRLRHRRLRCAADDRDGRLLQRSISRIGSRTPRVLASPDPSAYTSSLLAGFPKTLLFAATLLITTLPAPT